MADDIMAARLTHVQGFFRWAHIHGAAPLTPEMAKGFIHKPKVKQLSPPDILDDSEVVVMLESRQRTQRKPGEHALVRVTADAGLRVGEAINLRAGGCVPG